MIKTGVTHKMQLVDGEFTPLGALDLINSLINEKINLHQRHRPAIKRGNQDRYIRYNDNRVAELLQEKEDFKAIYKEALVAGKSININGLLTIEIIG